MPLSSRICGDFRLASGSYVLFINIAMAMLVAGGSVFAYLNDKRRVQALCWIAAALCVIANGVIEASMPHLDNFAPFRVAGYACFLAGLGFLGHGFCRQYRVQFPVGAAFTIFIVSLALNIAILDMERNSLLRMLLYHTPYALMGSLCLPAIARHKPKAVLDYLLFAVMALFNLYFLMRPLTARMLGGMGENASAYLSTPYAAFDQTVLAIVAMALVALMALLVVRDVIRNLTKVSVTDPLSGLLNRRGFLERAKAFIQSSRGAHRSVFLVIADIDHFKAINDQYGHEAGDQVIQAFGKMLETLSSAGTSVARIGGEEFAVLFTSPNLAVARLYCESIRIAAEIGSVDGQQSLPRFTASFGLAGLFSGETLESLTRRADLALYSAKQGGRNRVAIAELPLDRVVAAPLAA
jgi:diguanylate cyclase (GGDEF)-like protein